MSQITFLPKKWHSCPKSIGTKIAVLYKDVVFYAVEEPIQRIYRVFHAIVAITNRFISASRNDIQNLEKSFGKLF